jgi:hypothetical protein
VIYERTALQKVLTGEWTGEQLAEAIEAGEVEFLVVERGEDESWQDVEENAWPHPFAELQTRVDKAVFARIVAATHAARKATT